MNVNEVGSLLFFVQQALDMPECTALRGIGLRHFEAALGRLQSTQADPDTVSRVGQILDCLDIRA